MNTYHKIGVTLLISLLSVFLFSFFLEKGQKKYHVHKYKRVHEIFQGTENYEVLFIGSSRTHTTIYPKIVDSITEARSYNAGVEGGNLYEFELSLKGFLYGHQSPKLVVLTLDP